MKYKLGMFDKVMAKMLTLRVLVSKMLALISFVNFYIQLTNTQRSRDGSQIVKQ